MSLRNKILVSIIVIMTLIVALLTTNLAYDALARSQAERQRSADLMARLAQEWITDLVTTTGVPKDFSDPEWRLRVGNKFGQSSLFRRWVIVDPQFKVIAWNMAGEPRDEFKTEDLKSAVEQGRIVVRENTIAAPLLLPDGRRVCLRMNTEHLNPPPLGLVDRWQNVFIVMALGTILLIVTVYMLLNRLVVRPLEVLADASTRIKNKDYSRTVAEPDNYDEISNLIRTFNTMTYSLQKHREELEQKIEDETDRRRGTERRLVVAQRLSATGALAAGIAHEINNPLGGMLNAQALRTRPSQETAVPGDRFRGPRPHPGDGEKGSTVRAAKGQSKARRHDRSDTEIPRPREAPP
jgi:HAMP domain-containing protein